MLIILEGPDGAGKSTLATDLFTALQRHILLPSQLALGPAKIEILHRGPPTQHPVEEYLTPLEDYVPDTRQHIICDRWHLGEMVYPKVLKRPTKMTPELFEYIERGLLMLGAFMVQVLAPLPVLKERVRRRGDDLIKCEQLPLILRRYERWFSHSMLPQTSSMDEVSHIIELARIAEKRARSGIPT